MELVLGPDAGLDAGFTCAPEHERKWVDQTQHEESYCAGTGGHPRVPGFGEPLRKRTQAWWWNLEGRPPPAADEIIESTTKIVLGWTTLAKSKPGESRGAAKLRVLASTRPLNGYATKDKTAELPKGARRFLPPPTLHSL